MIEKLYERERKKNTKLFSILFALHFSPNLSCCPFSSCWTVKFEEIVIHLLILCPQEEDSTSTSSSFSFCSLSGCEYVCNDVIQYVNVPHVCYPITKKKNGMFLSKYKYFIFGIFPSLIYIYSILSPFLLAQKESCLFHSQCSAHNNIYMLWAYFMFSCT